MNSSPLQSLTVTLTQLYKRPVRVINDYMEESMLAHVSARPGVMEELQEIMEFRSRLPAKEKRFFPNSLPRLLSCWQETLDRARMYEPNPQDRSIASKQADRFIRQMEKEFGV